MPLRDAAPLGAPCWIELFTSDPDTTQDFYRQLFGWTCESAGEEYGGYFNFSKDGQRVAGGMGNDGSAGAPDGWSVYLATDDAQQVADAAGANGGTVVMPPMQVMALGTMVILGDPGGAVIGGWQPGEHKGFTVWGEPGTPGWFELHTRDYDKTVDFYRSVFGWETHVAGDSPDFRYTTLGEGENQQAGIMDASAFLPEGVPAHWSIYFATDDTDATLARVVELGGSVVEPAEDTPYGRLAQAADATGVRFKLVQPPA